MCMVRQEVWNGSSLKVGSLVYVMKDFDWDDGHACKGDIGIIEEEYDLYSEGNGIKNYKLPTVTFLKPRGKDKRTLCELDVEVLGPLRRWCNDL